MQLKDILEENSIKAISDKTNISEENLEALFAGEFELLKKVKTMGFISIIEREYGADMKALRKEARAYYDAHHDEDGIVLDAPLVERKKGRSKVIVLLILVLIGGASWYFATQFDRQKFKTLLPFYGSKTTSDVAIKDAVDRDPELSIEHAIENNRSN